MAGVLPTRPRPFARCPCKGQVPASAALSGLQLQLDLRSRSGQSLAPGVKARPSRLFTPGIRSVGRFPIHCAGLSILAPSRAAGPTPALAATGQVPGCRPARLPHRTYPLPIPGPRSGIGHCYCDPRRGPCRLPSRPLRHFMAAGHGQGHAIPSARRYSPATFPVRFWVGPSGPPAARADCPGIPRAGSLTGPRRSRSVGRFPRSP